MRKLLVSLTWFLVLVMLFSTLGCIPGGDNAPEPGDLTDPGDVNPDPGDDNPTDPGSTPDPGDDNPGNDPGDPGDSTGDPDQPPSYNLHSAVTVVPTEAIASVDRAIIRLGDLWLWASDGRMWRQTDSGEVHEVIWAPDGHALAYIQGQSLFYLVPGNSPVRLDDNICASKNWLNKVGFVWSPDSKGLAYGIEGGNQMRITWVPDMAKTSLLLDQPLHQGPYWLSNDNLVYNTYSEDERPTLIILNTLGDLINTLPDTGLPYPVPVGLVAATGTYDPDGAMETFYYTGLMRADISGSNLEQFYNQSPRFCLIARDPVTPNGLTLPRYLAISDCETLVLQKYGGLPNKAHPARVELLSQDVFLTFSEFCYPFWFSWAPDGSSLAALRFTFTQEGDYGEQEGCWDLVLVDKAGNWQTLNTLYYVSGDERPVPFQSVLPLNWSSCGGYVNYLMERDDLGYDLWRVDISTGSKELVMENCSLPEYRPH